VAAVLGSTASLRSVDYCSHCCLGWYHRSALNTRPKENCEEASSYRSIFKNRFGRRDAGRVHGSFSANIAALQNPIVDDVAYRNVRDYLNIHQLIAVGIADKVFDERVCYNQWSGVLVRHCKAAEKVIAHACLANNNYTYYHLKRRNKKWARRLNRWIKWHDANGKLRWPYWPSVAAIPTPPLLDKSADQNLARPAPETKDEIQSESMKPPAAGVVQLLVSCEGRPPLQSIPILLMYPPTATSVLKSSGAGTTTE
jgi:hypothetical protein